MEVLSWMNVPWPASGDTSRQRDCGALAGLFPGRGKAGNVALRAVSNGGKAQSAQVATPQRSLPGDEVDCKQNLHSEMKRGGSKRLLTQATQARTLAAWYLACALPTRPPWAFPQAVLLTHKD